MSTNPFVLLVAPACLDVFGTHSRDVLGRIFPFMNKGMHAARVPRMAGVPRAWIRMVFVGSAVSVLAVPVVFAVLHRMPSGGVRD